MAQESKEGKANKAQEFSIDLLKVYYDRLFPYGELFDWLSYSNNPSSDAPGNDSKFFHNREWSFTINDDIYVRYQAFKDRQEFEASIQKKVPHKIDIGAVYTLSPSGQAVAKSEHFHTVERELVFDIDMTDYDDIRTCCSGAEICRRCWPYMTMAVQVVDRTLRDDFAFRHILWVYSGRRGVHCWVCDPEARSLSNEARGAIVDYMSVHNGTAENSDKRLRNAFAAPHPMIRRAYEQLEPFFERYIADDDGQGLLSAERCVKVLNSLPNDSLRSEIFKQWDNDRKMSGSERWRILKEATTSPQPTSQFTQKRKRGVNYAELEAWRYELVFTHCYPRLDANVSKTQNHLLKSPFCVHPKTGRVCVPIDVSVADSFDPFQVPTVRSLCEEIDNYDREQGGDAETKVEDVKKTSLLSSIELFRRTFLNDLLLTNRQQIRDRADQEEAVRGEF